MNKYRQLLPYAMRQWPKLLFIGFLTALSSLAMALQPWPLKIVADYATQTSPIPGALRTAAAELGLGLTPSFLIACAGGLSLAIFVLNSLLEAGLTWGWALAGQGMVRDIALSVFDRLQRLSTRYHQQHTVGDSLDRLTSDTWCVYQLADGMLISPAQKVMTLATLGVVAWRLNHELAFYSLLTAPLMAWATWKFGAPLKRRARVTREARARLVSFVHQTLSSIPVVQTFSTADRNWDRFHELASDSISVSQRSALMSSYYGLVTGLITVMGTAGITYVGGRQVLAGTLSLGSFLVFLAYLRYLQGTAEGLLKIYGTLKPIEASVDRVLEVLESRDEGVRDRPESSSRPASTLPGQGQVKFEDVTFGYDADRPVLRNVSFAAEPGEVVALVGPSGAGKSTLASLIPRFYDPWSGRITYGGQDLRDIPLANLRSQIACVFQEPYLLPLTVAENLAYGRPSAARDEIVAAARAARADPFIQRLPQGYDTVVGDRGATLSGGERQRLAIARAMLRQAPVLILDEPTSALDAETEHLLMDALRELIKGRTTFIIAHRLSAIRLANRILVLENGKIVEAGSHFELLQHAGIYARYAQLQSGAENDSEVDV